MSAVFGRSQNTARMRGTRSRGLFGRRLMSRSDVKRTKCACRSQNRQLMRGGGHDFLLMRCTAPGRDPALSLANRRSNVT